MSTPTKLQVLLSKKRYLTLELQQVKAQHDEYYLEFVKHVKTLEQNHEMKIFKEVEKKLKKNKKKGTDDKVLKTLYRKIAVKAHPDKTDNDRKKTKLYRRATRAQKNNNAAELLDVCDELDIKIPPLPAKYYEEIEAAIDKLEVEVSQLRKKDCYLWGEADEELRKKMEEHIIRSTDQNK